MWKSIIIGFIANRHIPTLKALIVFSKVQGFMLPKIWTPYFLKSKARISSHFNMKGHIWNVLQKSSFWCCLFFVAGAMMPFFPENVDNVTVQIGQSAELRCTVENLQGYKVKSSLDKVGKTFLINHSTSTYFDGGNKSAFP